MSRYLYLDHSTTREPEFFWDAEAQPYPEGEFYMEPSGLDYDRLDPGIAPLVRKINATGWMTTVMSCEGHPERDNAYSAHPELWIRVQDDGLGRFFDWLERAMHIRRAISTVFKDGQVISVGFVGRTQFGYYFIVYGRFVSSVENRRVIRALNEALDGG